ncbi:MAG: hypothetical protein PHT69_05325 [Bacteroidales bacterium]|nr:hypothetical protein [Bacteroidales bacterium]
MKKTVTSNHLGNVLVTVSAKPRLLYDQNNAFLNKEADVTSVSDYFPFGMLAPERHWQSDGYRFGFNGMEADNEFKGSGNSYDFGARIYDPRIGRILSIDPLFSAFPSESNYVFAGNSPILYIDVDGKFKLEYSEEQLREWGVTEQQLQSFVNILKNIQSLVESNDNAMQALINTTGLDRNQILNDLKYNEGTTVQLVEGGGAFAGSGNEFSFGVDMIKQLTNENVDMAEQAFGVAMILLDEYAHVGDKRTNFGISTGDPVFNQPEGTQFWNISPTHHRGADPQVFGFGVIASSKTDPSGQIDVSKATKFDVKENLPGTENIPKNVNVSGLGEKLLRKSD